MTICKTLLRCFFGILSSGFNKLRQNLLRFVYVFLLVIIASCASAKISKKDALDLAFCTSFGSFLNNSKDYSETFGSLQRDELRIWKRSISVLEDAIQRFGKPKVWGTRQFDLAKDGYEDARTLVDDIVKNPKRRSLRERKKRVFFHFKECRRKISRMNF